jgi:hypothetical protein
MAWHECVNGNYVLCYRIGTTKFRRTLKTTSKEDADDEVQQFEINLRRVERGYLTIPKGADLVSFLLSNGHVAEPVTVREPITLKILFDRYFAALPEGSLEASTIRTMTVHTGRFRYQCREGRRESLLDTIEEQAQILNERQIIVNYLAVMD